MKSTAFLSTSILALFLGTAVVAGAQNGRSKGHEGGSHGQEAKGHHENGHASPSQHGDHHGSREFHDSIQRGPDHQAYRGHESGHVREVSRTWPGRQWSGYLIY